MKSIEIVGKNYSGYTNSSRTACRVIILCEGKMLLSYAEKSDVYMMPGGGMEKGESDRQCCVREVAEETGFLVEVSDLKLEISEYYEDCKYVSKYFIGNITGKCDTNLTEAEKIAGMRAVWLPVDEAISIFAKHDSYAGSDEMKKGIYEREYTALCKLKQSPPE